jgi:uncharacterized protein
MNQSSQPLSFQSPPLDLVDKPWWRYPIVWMVIGGPLSVVVAGVVTAVIAYQHVDPVLNTSVSRHNEHAANQPALIGRNMAAEQTMKSLSSKGKGHAP